MQIAPPGLPDQPVQARFIDRKFIGIPRGNTRLVRVDHGHLDVRAFRRDHRHGRTAHVPCSQTSYFHKNEPYFYTAAPAAESVY